MEKMDIIGAKKGGGGSVRVPVEDPDSLRSRDIAYLIDLLAEGEILGLVDGLKSVYLDGVPVENASGARNFEGLSLDFRHGTQDQDHIPGFPSVENEIAVSTEVRAASAVSRMVTNPAVDGVRVKVSVPSLTWQNKENGDLKGHSVTLDVMVTPSGGVPVKAKSITISGKTTTRYSRSVRVDLPAGRHPWTVQVVRASPDNATALINDKTFWDSYTEIIDAKLRYPNSALAALRVDSSHFSQIPQRGYHLRGKIIKVPSNYDPQARTYAGIWDGTFKPAYSNNPAWIVYDLAHDQRAGLGRYIPEGSLDKWGLYEIGRYCDELVDDGRGGKEPRFVCNCYLQSRAEAWRVLTDLCSAFRGMAMWGGGSVVFTQDRPRDASALYSAANVLDGRFTYAGTSHKTRNSVALVKWNDPADQFVSKVEYVQDDDAVRRFGVSEIEVSAFGCTSQAQARRVGRWMLYTQAMEDELVTFGVGLDSSFVMPGDVIQIADAQRSGVRMGGRVVAVDGTRLTLDAEAVGQTINLIGLDGAMMTRAVRGIAGRVVTLDQPADVMPGAMFVMVSAAVAPTLWRVVAVSEKPGPEITLEVTAARHHPEKYAAIEQGIVFEPPSSSVLPSANPPLPPSLLSVKSEIVETPAGVAYRLACSWEPSASIAVRGYLVDWRPESGNWTALPEASAVSCDIAGVPGGQPVTVRVRAVDAMGRASIGYASMAVTPGGRDSPPEQVSNLVATPQAMRVALSWRATPDDAIATVEVWHGLAPDNLRLAESLPRGSRAWRHDGLQIGVRHYYAVRQVDRWGNVSPYAYANAEPIKDPSALLDQLNGSIGFDALDEALRDPIANAGNIDASLDKIVEGVLEGVLSDDVIFSQQQADGESLAAVQTLVKTELGPDGALSQRIDTVIAKFDGDIAAVQETASAQADEINGVKAQYTLKVTAGGKVAGMGVYADENGGVVDFLADRFYVSQPNGSGSKQVFSVGEINGQSAVGINGELIVDGGVTARALNVETLSAISADIGSATAGELKSPTGKATINLNTGAADFRQVTIRAPDGSVVFDADGINGARIKEATIGTLQLATGAVASTAFASGDALNVYAPPGSAVLVIFSASASASRVTTTDYSSQWPMVARKGGAEIASTAFNGSVSRTISYANDTLFGSSSIAVVETIGSSGVESFSFSVDGRIPIAKRSISATILKR